MARVARVAWAGLLVLSVAGCGLFSRNPYPGAPDDSGNLVPYPSGYTVPPDSPDPFAEYTFPPLDFTPAPDVKPRPNDTPRPSIPDLAPYLQADLTLTNASDDPIDVQVDIVDTSTGKRTTIIALTLTSFGQKGQKVPATTYVVTFTRQSGSRSTCDVAIGNGGIVTFTALTSEVLLTTTGYTARSVADLDVSTSPACQAPLS